MKTFATYSVEKRDGGTWYTIDLSVREMNKAEFTALKAIVEKYTGLPL